MPAAASADVGTRTCRVATVPAAHENAISSSSNASTTASPPAVPCAATSIATPRKPATRAALVRPLGRPPLGTIQMMIGTKSGIVAAHSAAEPDGTYCSSRARRAWPTVKNSRPRTVAPAHSARLGHGARGSRRRQRPRRISPPPRLRRLIIMYGGIVSTA